MFRVRMCSFNTTNSTRKEYHPSRTVPGSIVVSQSRDVRNFLRRRPMPTAVIHDSRQQFFHDGVRNQLGPQLKCRLASFLSRSISLWLTTNPNESGLWPKL